MQHVQKFATLAEPQPSVAPLRVTAFRPSGGERLSRWAKETLTEETVTEVILGIFTFSLLAGLFVDLYYALENYTIIPWP